MNYHQIRNHKEAKVSKLIKECQMFFAFSDEQLAKGMKENPLTPGDKYASFGSGVYLPKSNVEKYQKGSQEIDRWKRAIIEENNMHDEVIRYELANHEAFYTGEIEDTYHALECEYTKEKIWDVYNLNYEKYSDF
jgi:hypothetical protein